MVAGRGGLVGLAMPPDGPVLPLFADDPLVVRAADGTALEVRRMGAARVAALAVGSQVGYDGGAGIGRACSCGC